MLHDGYTHDCEFSYKSFQITGEHRRFLSLNAQRSEQQEGEEW